MATPALLIIDMFSRFDFPEGQQLATLAQEVATRIGDLRAGFDNNGWPVIYANDNFGNWKCGFRELAEECLKTTGPSQKIAKILFPAAEHYTLLKPKHSAFLSTPLEILLEKLDVDLLVLTGMALDSCVLATAIDANSRELRCVVPNDATAVLPERRSATLSVLEKSQVAKVSSTAELRSKWFK